MDSIKIRNVQSQEQELINQIVEIHLKAFPQFFLTFMGRGFLRLLYKSYCNHPQSGILAAVDAKEAPLGFLAYSKNMSGLYKYLIKNKLPLFIWYGAGAFFRKPTIFMRLIRAFLKPAESKAVEAYVELASIGVSPDIKCKGLGSSLIKKLKEMVDFTEYSYIKLETDAKNNESVNSFYRKNGFILFRTYETAEGRLMNEYRFADKNTKKDETSICL